MEHILLLTITHPQLLSEKAVLRVISEKNMSSNNTWYQLFILLPTSFYEKTHLLRLELGRLKILLFFESTVQILFALLEAFSGNKTHCCKMLLSQGSITTVSKHLSEWH